MKAMSYSPVQVGCEPVQLAEFPDADNEHVLVVEPPVSWQPDEHEQVHRDPALLVLVQVTAPLDGDDNDDEHRAAGSSDKQQIVGIEDLQ